MSPSNNLQESSAGVHAHENQSAGRVYPWDKRLVKRLLGSLGDPPVEIVLWNGEAVRTSSAATIARVHFLERRSLLKSLFDADRHFGDEYRDGRVEVEGDLVRLLEEAYRGMRWSDEGRRRWVWRRRNTIADSRENIHHHYDIGNRFYKLWLDEQLAYTCAYFADPAMSLAEAQFAKMEHVCRKLRLQPGERVIEAGCGWGALSMHMARHFGVRVRAFNIAREQILYAREAAERAGLNDRVEFIEDDYRNIHEECDAFASVGMLEHVGIANYRTLGAVIDRCLTRNGRGLIHSIGRHRSEPFSEWMRRRIFPGAEVPTLREMMDVFEPFDFAVLDIENLRLHYAATLRHWLTRFEGSVDAVRSMFDERFVRTWRFYLSSSIAAFNSGSMQLFQVLFNRHASNDVPMTRAHLYPSSAGSH